MSAASTSAKSPVIAGPSCGPMSSAAGPVISVRYITRVRPPGSGSSRCIVRTTKSPASIWSVNDSPDTISTMRNRTGSSPGGVIANVVPTANGPSISIFSMPSFQLGHAAKSDQQRHNASRVAFVSTLCSYSHMIPPGPLNLGLCLLAPPRHFRGGACISLARLSSACRAAGNADDHLGCCRKADAPLTCACRIGGRRPCRDVGRSPGSLDTTAELQERQRQLTGTAASAGPAGATSQAQGTKEYGSLGDAGRYTLRFTARVLPGTAGRSKIATRGTL